MQDPAFLKGGPRFRPAVAALVLDEQDRLMVGRRNDSQTPHWQFPQGGMDDGETPEEAVLREIQEELGTSQVEILGVLPRRTRYVWTGPDSGGPFDGQAHVWFVVRLLGVLEEENESEEFDQFEWIDPDQLLARTHPVRRATYSEVAAMFKEWRDERNGASGEVED